LAQARRVFGNGILFLGEELVASALGMKRRVIKKRAHFRIAALGSENIELFFRAVKIAGKAKQLKKKRAALGVGRIVANFRVQSLYSVL
jgi:hypothetical protein